MASENQETLVNLSKPSTSRTYETKSQCHRPPKNTENPKFVLNSNTKNPIQSRFNKKKTKTKLKKNNVTTENAPYLKGVTHTVKNEEGKTLKNANLITKTVERSHLRNRKVRNDRGISNADSQNDSNKRNKHAHQRTETRQTHGGKENPPGKHNKSKKKNLLKTKTLEIMKELKLASNDENTCDFEKISEMYINTNISVDYDVLMGFIDLVSEISGKESPRNLEILQIVFQKQFLDAILKFMQDKTKELTKSDEGTKKCNLFFHKFLKLSKLAIKLLPASSLIFLKHTLMFTKLILVRLKGRIDIGLTHQQFDFQEMTILIDEKTKMEELARESVSPSDVEHMKNMKILPTEEDLFGKPPELKKNIVEGAYKNTDHYLTVQFTLLREDFIAPLREGILQFLSQSKKKTQVSVYHKVRITHATIDSGKFGHIVKLSGKVKWEIVTRFFIFGSLLLFTTNYFKSFFIGTVIDVDTQKQTIMVKLDSNYVKICKDVYAQEFIMAVSKVFYEPYHHVLSGLQEMASDEFPMKEYIIEVSPEVRSPVYIKELKLDEYTIFDKTVEILNPCWPQFTSVNLNASQQKAFQAALTNEFVVIQGPPGTGKTFVGLQIVSALLENVHINSPILIVCYKNHALDQFLEGILNKTKNVIRIGGRSKNENLKQFNLKDRRSSYGYRDHKEFLLGLASHYFRTERHLDGLRKHGILSVQNVLPHVASPTFREELMNTIFEEWLMEGMYIDEVDESDNEEDFNNSVENKSGSQEKLNESLDLQWNDTNSQSETLNQIFSHIPDFEYNNCESKETDFESHVGDINGSLGVQLEDKTLNNLQRSDSCFQEDIDSKMLPVYEEGDDGFDIDQFGIESDRNYSQTCSNQYVELDTFSETGITQEQKNVTSVHDEEKLYFSAESKQRIDEMYIDDYANIYAEVTQGDEGLMQNNNVGSDANRETPIEVPFFTLTIRYLKDLCWQSKFWIQHLEENGDNNDRDYWQSNYELHTKQITFLQKMLSKKQHFQSKRVEKIYALGEKYGIWALNNNERWLLYHSWINHLADDLRAELIRLEESIYFGEQQLDKARSAADLEILKKAKVVGMTTSGAAKNRSTLNKLGANIVVIEEAAEVLESHIVTSLSSKCQHLILIGDHKQLRPNPAVYKLCKQHNLDVSMFERMVRNGLSCHTLDVQHRMRPEFASLIVPSIYPHLINHRSTENRPDIKGVHSNLFFINHDHPEEQLLETDSHVNKFEAKFALELAFYLLLQGYTTDEITILATYKGQVRKLLKMRDQFSPDIRDLMISTVDDFQGEENKIIILSLVRSNEENSIGFLATENRVCVALSRAREGFYIVGNMACLTHNNQIWPQVREKLMENNALGDTLSVYCQNHQETVTQVKEGGKFKEMPEGGCQRMCEVKLGCGHACKYHCHPRDQQHLGKYMCSVPCERTCRLGHPCSRLCGEECGLCMEKVEYELDCGHLQKDFCSSDPATVICHTPVSFLLPCGHELTILCYEAAETVMGKKCEVVCGKNMLCGHTCDEICGHKELCDQLICQVKVEKTCLNGHKVIFECWDKEKLCNKIVEKTLQCGHRHSSPCYVSQDPVICSVEVEKTLECEHTQLVACGKALQDVFCSKEVLKELSCGHNMFASCGTPSESLDGLCPEPCKRILACGHLCENQCAQCCFCCIIVEKELPCGHVVKAQCGVEKVECHHQCERDLKCGHKCKGKCASKCDASKCEQPVPCNVSPACGHGPVTVPCFVNQKGVPAEKLVKLCKTECKALLQCGHFCDRECRSCKATNSHALCNQSCQMMLTCGHRCPKKCHEKCGGCDQRCLNKCSHRACDRKCGEPCQLCQEPCSQGCVHKRCSRQCFMFCNRRPCNLPCSALLRCGHPCLGFCGERCPPLCLQCNPQHAVPTGRMVTARFIVLEDCGHIVDAARMDGLFNRNKFCIVKCPAVTCQTPIITTKRYHKEVTETFLYLKRVRQMGENRSNNIESGINFCERRAQGHPYPAAAGSTHCNNAHERAYRQGQYAGTHNNPRGRPYHSSQFGGTSNNPHYNNGSRRSYQSSQQGGTSNHSQDTIGANGRHPGQYRGTSNNPHYNNGSRRPYQSNQQGGTSNNSQDNNGANGRHPGQYRANYNRFRNNNLRGRSYQ